MTTKKIPKDKAITGKRLPRWKRRLEEYQATDLIKITFSSEGDLDAGTALIWGGRLTGAPFRLDPNGPSLSVPKATAPFFAAAGIQFTLHPAFRKPVN